MSDSKSGLQTAWNSAYERNDHARMWDCPWPSPELVGYIAASEVRDGARAIDLGCGTGSDALFLAQQRFDVVGVDVSDHALDLARSRPTTLDSRVQWLCADVRAIPLPDRAYSLITDRGCLHHVAEEHRQAYANEVSRLLKSGGRLFLRGMSGSGRNKHPVDTAALERHFDNDHLRIVFSTPFDMIGPHGTAAATLAIIEKR